jgi:hypothetical protein
MGLIGGDERAYSITVQYMPLFGLAGCALLLAVGTTWIVHYSPKAPAACLLVFEIFLLGPHEV